MKRFAFTLQRMLGFKRTMYERERNELLLLRAQRVQLEKRKEDAKRQMLRMDAEFRQKAADEGVRIEEVTRQNFHRENAHKLDKELAEQIERKDHQIELQMQVVLALDKEVKSLEKLRESQWEQYRKDSMREENERILEIVSQRYVEEQVLETREQERREKARRAI